MKFLIIQTAFIGDVILATAVVEKLHRFFPHAEIDFLLRKGNESLLTGHPFLHKVWILDKKQGKFRNLLQLIRAFRRERYDHVINLHRFFSTGLITICSGAKHTVGFDKNPLSFGFGKKVRHQFGEGIHEVDRNLSLIVHLTDTAFEKPRLYPGELDPAGLEPANPYVCMAPASVWFTKQYPQAKWIELIDRLDHGYTVYLLGGPGDKDICEAIKGETNHPGVFNMAGQLSFLASAALMKGARMNYVNDSAPLHMASAVDAPVAAVFCSTVPAFGFTPLSSVSYVMETEEKLACRPCGLHGKNACPEGHFRCAQIEVERLLSVL